MWAACGLAVGTAQGVTRVPEQVKLPSKAVESYTGEGPVAKSGAAVNYGPYAGVAPFAGGTAAVHFENNSPFVEALSCVREVQVSHWGNVYVEEWYTIKHTGAVQKVLFVALPACAPPGSGEPHWGLQHGRAASPPAVMHGGWLLLLRQPSLGRLPRG